MRGNNATLGGTLDFSDSIHKMGCVAQHSRSGDNGYSSVQCPFRGAKYHHCRKIRQIKRACLSRKPRPPVFKQQKKPLSEVLKEEPISTVVSEEEGSEQAPSDKYILHQVASQFSKPLMIQVEINHKSVTKKLFKVY